MIIEKKTPTNKLITYKSWDIILTICDIFTFEIDSIVLKWQLTHPSRSIFLIYHVYKIIQTKQKKYQHTATVSCSQFLDVVNVVNVAPQMISNTNGLPQVKVRV